MNNDRIVLALKNIVLDDRLQARTKLNAGNVAKLVARYRSEAPPPPVTVAKVDGAWLLLDGWHRVAAMTQLGINEAEVEIEAGVTTRREAVRFAALANTAHGLQLTANELKRAFQMYVRANCHWRDARGSKLKPFREIGQEFGRSQQTVWRWMTKYFPRIAAQYRIGEEASSRKTRKKERTMTDVTFDMLREIEAPARAVRDPKDRGEIIAALRALAADLERTGASTQPETGDF